MITVNFFTTLRFFLNTRQIQFPAAELDIQTLLHLCEERLCKKFLHKLLTPDDQVMPGTIILINGLNIHHLNGLKTVVTGDDVVALFPPGGGG
ncbi:MoaD family protein [Candidatus Moduliflexus flocculans]|uniref:MoaD family protein n=1 Tax=Candidatus Moduliflexus flocculans TaxID=1499966 RepID=A0A081BMX1_9BACT|nr:MoaD family protein [Candidatus Moduliflexus flocculans]